MSNAAAKKVFVQIETAEEQEENIKNQRKTLKLLQDDATDKENLAGRPQFDKLIRLKTAAAEPTQLAENAKRKKIETRSIETQTDEISKPAITIEDLTTDGEPSIFYWKTVAEKRRIALDETLSDNERLEELVIGLKKELHASNKLVEESQCIVEVLKDIIAEQEAAVIAANDNIPSTSTANKNKKVTFSILDQIIPIGFTDSESDEFRGFAESGDAEATDDAEEDDAKDAA